LNKNLEKSIIALRKNYKFKLETKQGNIDGINGFRVPLQVAGRFKVFTDYPDREDKLK
jgi:hypothetical protein